MAYTKHGHHIPGSVLGDTPKPPSRARCGGVRLCDICRGEAADYLDARTKTSSSDSPWLKAEKIVKSYVYARYSILFDGRLDVTVEFTSFSQNGSNWEAVLTTSLCDGRFYELVYDSKNKKTRLREYQIENEINISDDAVI